jgi:hypothetical protein
MSYRKALIRWRSDEVGTLEKTILDHYNRLVAVQGEEVTPEMGRSGMLQKDLKILLEQDDLKWRQQSKINWLSQGDKKLKFFHACVNYRRKVNKITHILDEMEDKWETQEALGEAFAS